MNQSITSSAGKSSISFTKRSLAAHTWLGLFISAIMYMICLSGTIAVFHQEFERWEQPQITEMQDFSTDAVDKAYDDFVARYPQDTGHMHVVFPSSGIPRLVVENDHVAHFVEPDGSLAQIEKPLWTKMLVDLHLYMHLPQSFGMVLVSAFGALLCALIISGFLAHPRIIKDAFRWRRGGTGLQENIDLHNRFSVWASPFHIMIAITGAYFGLAGILIVLISQAFYGGDRQAVIDLAFTPEPELSQPLVRPKIDEAINYVQQNDPEGELIFLTVHEPNTTGQFIEIYVKQPGRLIYSENYRFDVDGKFIGTGGYKNGPAGKQIIYSMYRLHFGDFFGLTSKILYFILGLMLTAVSATGINIWLKKRKHEDIFNRLWPAFVWGSPTALALSASLQLYINIRLDASLWIIITVILAGTIRHKNVHELNRYLKLALSISILVLLVTYSLKFGSASFSIAALQLNIPLLLFAIMLAYKNWFQKVK